MARGGRRAARLELAGIQVDGSRRRRVDPPPLHFSAGSAMLDLAGIAAPGALGDERRFCEARETRRAQSH